MMMTHMSIGMSIGSDWIGKVFIIIGNSNWWLQTCADSEPSEKFIESISHDLVPHRYLDALSD